MCPQLPHYLDLTLEQARDLIVQAGQKPFRAKQIADWVYKKSITDPASMTNIPAKLKESFTYSTSRIAARADSRDGTTKLLLELADGNQIETVLIPSHDRNTACVSTQAGCAMGCVFCATGLDGLQRNLTCGEILEQVIQLQQATDKRISNVVFMGMGEPLANYDATVAAVRALIDPERFALSARKITVSTIGLPAQIRKLASEDLPITLAISLHAPTDALRQQLIPYAARTPLAEIITAAQDFFLARKREITLEYILLGDVNDKPQHAEKLAYIARQLRCNVNLIPYNPTPNLPFTAPSRQNVDAFAAKLRAQHVNTTLRQSRGADIAAACGQLRKRIAQNEPHAK